MSINQQIATGYAYGARGGRMHLLHKTSDSRGLCGVYIPIHWTRMAGSPPVLACSTCRTVAKRWQERLS